MADIELVFKIPEIEYEHLTNKEKFCSLTKSKQEWLINKTLDRVADGTPLPKGHGKLIAEPTEEDIAKTIGGQNDFTECIKDAVKAVFDNADAIIEADRSEENGNDD